MQEALVANRFSTFVDVVERWIRNAILAGKLRPNERIDQDAIAHELQVSRMPVREALIRLEKAGFVIIQPHRGSKVAPLSVDHIREVYLMRASLESLAARIAAEHMTEDIINRLDTILAQTKEAIREGDGERRLDLNRDFHSTGYEASGMTFLCRTINDLRDHCDRYRRHQVRIADRATESYQEHQHIFEAWREHDPLAAERYTRINLENSGKSLIGRLQEEENLVGKVAHPHPEDRPVRKEAGVDA